MLRWWDVNYSWVASSREWMIRGTEVQADIFLDHYNQNLFMCRVHVSPTHHICIICAFYFFTLYLEWLPGIVPQCKKKIFKIRSYLWDQEGLEWNIRHFLGIQTVFVTVKSILSDQWWNVISFLLDGVSKYISGSCLELNPWIRPAIKHLWCVYFYFKFFGINMNQSLTLPIYKCT